MGKRWTWVAWSRRAVFIVSMVFTTILAVANGTLQQDAANQVVLYLGFSAFIVVGVLIVRCLALFELPELKARRPATSLRRW